MSKVKNMFTQEWEKMPDIKDCGSNTVVISESPPWFNYKGSTTPAFQKKNVARGRHPFGQPLHDDPDLHCRDCRFAYRKNFRNGKYWKCSVFRDTHGPGTDLRLKWRACSGFKPKDV